MPSTKQPKSPPQIFTKLKEGVQDVFGLYRRRKKRQSSNAPPVPSIPTAAVSLPPTLDLEPGKSPQLYQIEREQKMSHLPSLKDETDMLDSIQEQLDAIKDGNKTLESLYDLKKIFPYLERPLSEEYLSDVKKTLHRTERLYRKLEEAIRTQDRSWAEILDRKPMIDNQLLDGIENAKKTELQFRYNESSAVIYYYGPDNAKVFKLTVHDLKRPKGSFGEIEYGLYYHKDEDWPRRAVVMKRLKVSGIQRSKMSDLRRRVEREAAIWSSLKHENVVDFLGLFKPFKPGDEPSNATSEHENDLYLVSPFSRLKILEEHCANLYVSKHRDGFPSIMDNIIDGLHYLHTVKFFRHGDLKGDNVIVFLEDGILSAKLTDFGLSGSATEKKLRSTQVGSETRWSPPEYLRGEEDAKELTYAGDVWSLAMTMQELILCAVLQQSEINPFFDIPNKGRDNIFYTFMQDPTESEFDLKMSDYISLLPPCQHNAFPPIWRKNPALRPTIEIVREGWKAQYSQLLVEWPDFNPYIHEYSD